MSTDWLLSKRQTLFSMDISCGLESPDRKWSDAKAFQKEEAARLYSSGVLHGGKLELISEAINRFFQPLQNGVALGRRFERRDQQAVVAPRVYTCNRTHREGTGVIRLKPLQSGRAFKVSADITGDGEQGRVRLVCQTLV